jgi:hypothetical protein
MNQVIKQGTIWVPKISLIKKELYRVLEDSDFDGVCATTKVRTETVIEDSFIWFGPVEDFLQSFEPAK